MRTRNHKLLIRLAPAVLFTFVVAFGFVSTANAQPFPYASQPDCPYQAGNFTDASCTYPNGQQAVCSGNLNTGNLTCQNPDGSTTRYSSFAGEGTIGEGCEVRSSGSQEWRNCGTTTVTESTVSTPVVDEGGNVTDQEYQTQGVGGVLQFAAQCAMNGLVDCTFQVVGLAMVSIATFFLGVAGVLFNFVVVKLVFEFGSVIGNSPGLLLAWGMMRDIGNMVLLFGFIFIGIMTLLDVQTYAVKKTLPKLIIFAILMNFSLFAAEAVIDTANVFASSMYLQADPCSTVNNLSDAQGGEYDLNADNCAINSGLAGSIMNASGLSSLFQAKDNTFQDMYIYVGIALLALIGAFVMFAASFMLISRAIVLTFLMVTAPLAFAGFAIPPLQKTAWNWWHKLIENAFFAPLLILLILVSIKVTEGFGSVGGDGLAGALSAPNSTAMGAFLVFALVIGFMLASIIVAKKMGAFGANFAVKTAGNIALGGAGFVGRNTAGAASARIGRAVRRSSLGSTDTGRMVAGAFDRGARSSFDLRTSKLVKDNAKKQGLDLGAPSKAAAGGIEGVRKARDEARRKYGEALGLSPTEEENEKEIKTIEEEEKTRNKTAEEALKNRKKTADARHSTESRRLETGITDLEQKVQQNSAGGRKQQLQQEIDQARKVSDERLRQGDSEGSIKAHQEQQALEDTLAQLDEQIRLDQEKLDQLRAAKDLEDQRYAGELAEISEESRRNNVINNAELERINASRTQNDRRLRYADNIENKRVALPFGPTQGVKERQKKTADAIRKKMGQSSKDKAVDALKAAFDDVEKNSKEDDDAGESK